MNSGSSRSNVGSEQLQGRLLMSAAFPSALGTEPAGVLGDNSGHVTMSSRGDKKNASVLPAKKRSAKASVGETVGGVAGAIGGYLLVEYSGALLFGILAGLAALLLLVFTKTRFRPPYFRSAISVSGAQLLFFTIATVILGAWSLAIDIMLLAVGIVWLWLRPGLVSALFLGVFQLVSLAVNVVALMSVSVGEPTHRALVVHCVVRVLVLACLAAGYRRLKRDRRTAV